MNCSQDIFIHTEFDRQSFTLIQQKDEQSQPIWDRAIQMEIDSQTSKGLLETSVWASFG